MSLSVYTLVTGAFGGLGTAIVRRLIEDGQQVIATDRRIEDGDAWLEGFKDPLRQHILMRSLDVTKLEEIESLRDELRAQDIHVDRLVNNAAAKLSDVQRRRFGTTTTFLHNNQVTRRRQNTLRTASWHLPLVLQMNTSATPT